jgi:sulfur-oxidizing protein SoxB
MEATMDNLLLKALVDISGAELAFSNGWRYGTPVVPGPITVNDLWNIIPTNPPVSV